jgi:TPP-dependent pyruvate/acetoin dehydrogenase alpha subunit
VTAKAAAYAVPAESVDGMDVLAVEDAARRAVARIRAGGGPVFVEFRTYRFRAHSMFDPELYRDRAEVEAWKQRDPIPALAARLREAGLVAADEVRALEAEAARELEEAVAFADASPLEPVETLTRHLQAEPHTP